MKKVSLHFNKNFINKLKKKVPQKILDLDFEFYGNKYGYMLFVCRMAYYPFLG